MIASVFFATKRKYLIPFAPAGFAGKPFWDIIKAGHVLLNALVRPAGGAYSAIQAVIAAVNIVSVLRAVSVPPSRK